MANTDRKRRWNKTFESVRFYSAKPTQKLSQYVLTRENGHFPKLPQKKGHLTIKKGHFRPECYEHTIKKGHATGQVRGLSESNFGMIL